MTIETRANDPGRSTPRSVINPLAMSFLYRTKFARTPPEAREVQRVLNQTEASFLGRMERVGGFGGKADLRVLRAFR